jgi:ribose transport system permease protein
VIAIALGACVVAGFVNGFVIVKLKVNSFIATLGTSQVLLAVSLLISSNEQIIAHFPGSWSQVANDSVAGVPYTLFLLIFVAIILWYVLERTPLGRYLAATGGNAEAARLSGVRTVSLVWGSLVVSALIAGIAGVIYATRIGLSSATVGAGLLFPAVTAVFLGASQFLARANVWGTLVAYFTLAFGIQGINVALGASAAWASPLFQGVALIVAVAIASRPLLRRLRPATEIKPGSDDPVDRVPPQGEQVAVR